jgi:hypothetical protein
MLHYFYNRTLIGKGAVPMGEFHLFPKFQQKIYEWYVLIFNYLIYSIKYI